jgi:hypothetical protein
MFFLQLVRAGIARQRIAYFFQESKPTVVVHKAVLRYATIGHGLRLPFRALVREARDNGPDHGQDLEHK